MTSIFSTEERGGIAGNLAYAVVATGIGLLSSTLTSLVLPKFLGVEDYAYWQLFLLYSSSVGSPCSDSMTAFTCVSVASATRRLITGS